MSILNRKKKIVDHRDETVVIGKDLSFATSEAYRLLRTNLLFSLPDEQRCRIVGITSADAGEGKSATAVNLSYMLAEMGKQVLLIECDMRLPTLSKRIGVTASPGLSNLLVGMSFLSDVIQPSGLEENFYVITAGDIPPNPSELLGSELMRNMIEACATSKDFIIIDLPPVNEVADALVMSRLVDGMIMIVRQDYANRHALNSAMRQLQNADAKVLGFVLTGAGTQNKWGGYKYKYKYKSKYGKYGYRRGSYYSHSKYAEAAEENQAANSSESVSPNSAQAEQIAGQDHKDSWGARY